MDVRSKKNELEFHPRLHKAADWGWIGVACDKQRQQNDSLFEAKEEGFTLGIVEFDDQGRCHNRDQMHAIAKKLESFGDQEPIIVLFNHGWKHNADSKDANLTEFCNLLKGIADHPDRQASARPVFGIYSAWRGQSFYWGGFGENFTFWNRKPAGLRVAMGSARELFERLHDYRKSADKKGKKPVVIVAGHSFGGLIVFSALCQSLIAAALTPSDKIVPSFTNLVLLVNPAFEAIRYMPIVDVITERQESEHIKDQTPVFISVTTKNDWATGLAFPTGMIAGAPLQYIQWPKNIALMANTMGHVRSLQTHELLAEKLGTKKVAKLNPLPLKPKEHMRSPFWVVSTTKEVVDGHNGIWKPIFTDWIKERVIEQLASPQVVQLRKEVPAAGEGGIGELPK